MSFETYEYVRPEMESFSQAFNQLLDQFEAATSVKEQHQLFKEINEMRTEFNSMYNICHIRHTINTRDEFYEAENNFFDQQLPHFEALNNRFYKALLASTHRADLEKRWGKQLFVLAELNLKTFEPVILKDM